MKIRCILATALLLCLNACAGDTAGVPVLEDTGSTQQPDVGLTDTNTDEPDTAEPDASPQPDTGEEKGGTGDPCSDGDECVSGICLDGACAEECTGAGDCPSGTTCEQLDNGVFACVALLPCTANSDCGGDQCVVDRSGAEVGVQCDDPVGAGGVGAQCSNDAACASGLCLDGGCSAPCDTSNDCSTTGQFICESETLTATGGGTATVNVCKPKPAGTCISDAECPGSERCVATKTSTTLTFSCGPAVGSAESIDACSADADCANNLCVDGVCAGPCGVVGDCGGAPNRCVVTNVALGSGASASAQICQPARACASPGDCPSGDVCYVQETSSEVAPICRAANPGGGTLGQVCTGDSDCANNFCLPTRFRDVCSAPCANNSDCTVPGYECGTVTVDLSGGGTDTVSMCVPKAPPACSAESDCATGLDCAIIPNAAGTALESVCVPATGGTATGTACTSDSSCQSLHCHNGFCASPCTDNTQCSSGQLCVSESVSKGGVSGNFDICTTLPDQQCTSTQDCTDGTRVCGDLRDTNGDTYLDAGFCRFPNVGKSQLGAACNVGSDCRENVCLGFAGECTVVCDQNTDCAAGQTCTTFMGNATDGYLNFCNTACSDNSDCGADRRCTINSDAIGNTIDQICIKTVGAGILGASCADGSTCETGLCLTTTQYTATSCTSDATCATGQTCECPIDDPNCTTGKLCATSENHCTNLCDDNSDCTGGVAGNPLTTCSPEIRTSLPDGSGGVNISACAKPDP